MLIKFGNSSVMKDFLSGFVFLLLQQQLTGKYKIVARGEE